MPAQAPREIELKLELDPAEAADLRTRILPALGAAAPARHLASVYFDTPKQALRRKGLTLRIRFDGERRTQTIKAGGGAGLFDRSEWETEVAGDTPDLKAAAKTPVRAVLHRRARLGPVFETLVERTTWTVETAQAAVEVALDEGCVRAAGASAPLAELEFELKRGEAAALFALIRRLDMPSPPVAVRAKSERGYALLDGEPPAAFKPDPIALASGVGTAEGFRAIAHACIRQFRLNEPLIGDAHAPEPLHQARVAIRRLRTALSFFAPVVADDSLAPLKARLRDVSHRLGAARDLDVYLLLKAQPEAERNPDEPGLSAFVGAVETKRAKAHDAVVAMLASEPFHGLIFDLVEWIEMGPWRADPSRAALRDGPLQAFAAERLRRWRRQVRRKGRALGERDPAARHRIRIRAKKLRYASEFFAGLAEGRSGRGRKRKARRDGFLDAVEALQKSLGDLNDIRIDRAIAQDFADGDAGRADAALVPAAHISGGQDARGGDLLKAAVAAYAVFAKTKPFWRRW